MAGSFVDNVNVSSSHVAGSWTADEIVGDQYSRMSEISTEIYGKTLQFVDAINSASDGLVVPSTEDIKVEDPEIASIDVSSRPSFGNLSLSSNWPAAAPSLPTLYDISEIPEILMPALTATQPTYVNPERPTLDVITAPGDVPVISMPEAPAMPDIVFPDAPVLSEIALPSAPDINLPEFSASLSEFTVNIPEGFSWEEDPYNSDVWNDLLNKVRDGIVNGGTGLDPEVEAAIWNNALLRQQAENDKRRREIDKEFVARGFVMPTGAYVGKLAELDADIARNNTDLNQKIAIAQADLAQKNTQFAISTGVELEKILRAFHESRMNRSLQVAQQIVILAVQVYNAHITRYNLEVERFKAESLVYEAQVRAALSKVEIFRAQIEAASLTAELQKAAVNIYQAKVAALETHVRVYNTQMESVKIALSIETARLDGFRLETEAYVARLNAEKIKFDIYAVENEAEKTKASVYAEQVRAHIAEVEAKKAELSLYTARSDADLQKNTALIEAYKAELAGYTAQIQMNTAQTNAEVEGFKAEVSAYNAETSAYGQLYEVKSKEITLQIENARFKLEKAKAEIDAATQGYIAINELKMKGLDTVTSVGSQLSASAWNAVHTSASLNQSSQKSYSESQTLSNQLSENHSYSEA